MAARQIMCIAAAAHDRLLLARAEIASKHLHRTCTVGNRHRCEQYCSPAGQEFRPEVIIFTTGAVWLGEGSWRPSSRRNALQAPCGKGGEDDHVIGRPGRAYKVAVELHQRDHRTASKPHLIERKIIR